MNKQDKIDKFLKDGYKDFDVAYCNAGLTLMWIAGSFLYIFGPNSWICGIIFSVVNIITTVFAYIIKKKYADLRLARYLFNVLILTWITLFITTFAYRLFVGYDKYNNWLLYLALLMLSAFTTVASALLWYIFIVKKNESKKRRTSPGKVSLATIIFALSGYSLAPFISEVLNSDSDSAGIACLAVIMALLMAMLDGMLLLKLYLFSQNKENLKITIKEMNAGKTGDGSLSSDES